MKNPRANAERWLRQAEYDLGVAQKLLEDSAFAYAAFHAEQSAQKSLKAYLLLGGRRFIPTHSVGELAQQAAALEASFGPLVDQAKRLDRHYLTSRYPDALPEPAIPAEAYVRSDADEAVGISRKIFEICKSVIGK